MRKFFTLLMLLTGIATMNVVSPSELSAKDPVSVNSLMQCEHAGICLMAATIDATATIQDEKDKNVLGNAQRIKIVNLGPIVNYSGVDYAPTVSADGKTLYFVSDRQGSKLTKDGASSHDFWAAKKEYRMDSVFFQPYNIDTETTYGDRSVNTSYHEGAASIAADNQTLYFTACNRADGFGSCDIYKSTIEGDKWSLPINLGANVNSKYWDSQPSISPDQKRLYFASTRPGPHSKGKGSFDEMDIWYCDYDDDEEEWKPAVNLEALNTSEQDWTPFISADNQTLFFSSNGHKPRVGGLDFYFSRSEDGINWAAPQNLGEPINTKEDDSFITLPASGDIIYFASKRTDIPRYQGDYDIFMAFVPSFFKTVNLKVKVVDECTQANIPANITITNPITGKKTLDSVTVSRHEMEMIVGNTDYGNPKDSIPFINYEIVASNPAYGTSTKIQRIDKPTITYKKEQEGEVADEVVVTISLGQRPVLGTNIAEADYVRRWKSEKPELAQFNGLVMEEILTWDLYPLLNYVFFDEGSAELPSRYKIFKNASQTAGFSDTTIPGGTLDKYYHMLNIYGFRLNKNPESKIEIVGCNDGTRPAEKTTKDLSKNRATLVYNYFKDIWNISPDRMKLTFRDKPALVSNLQDSLGITENRRVEILCKDWEIMKPVFEVDTRTVPQPDTMQWTMRNGIDDQIVSKRRIEIKKDGEMWKQIDDIGTVDAVKMWDWMNDDLEYPVNEAPYKAQLIVTSNTGNECASDIITVPVKQIKASDRVVGTTKDSTYERYNLILFPFNSADAGPINQRIMNDYVYGRVKASSSVIVIGHTDVVGLYEHNQKLSERRSAAVKTGIDNKTGKQYGELKSHGVGEDDALYTNDLPEGRFYNRTVQVIIRTPVSEYENK